MEQNKDKIRHILQYYYDKGKNSSHAANNVWVPHDLTQKNIFARMDACESLLNGNKIDPFLKQMVTGDE